MKKFVIPTIEEANEYARSIGYYSFNVKKWWHHYNANGWFRGKTKMRSWKSAIWTWFCTTDEHRRLKEKEHLESLQTTYQKEQKAVKIATPEQKAKIAAKVQKFGRKVEAGQMGEAEFQERKDEQLQKLRKPND